MNARLRHHAFSSDEDESKSGGTRAISSSTSRSEMVEFLHGQDDEFNSTWQVYVNCVDKLNTK
ncbi:hypothetical protein GN244_ATG00135 [Phytophthora infestans]|uniref:Uncharacterized protein n=1 Tax=Phytophthora infestans TaxID=4787 RepID=A0A833TI76_PHYIN|nr:hypothetical protein GN244_ATG00135 [Phytophthora infestans]KAF4142798.1 hypothetical protein GN958_ATG08026 [Phytophthora infestans]